MRIPILSILVLSLLAVPAARADVLVLKSGGEVRGQLRELPQAGNDIYVVQTLAGGTIEIQATDVEKVVRSKPVAMEYEQKRLAMPDTLEGHLQIAEWCRENRLSKQREVHLQRVMEFDPENSLARKALNFVRDAGRWIKRDDLMRERGYVKHGGKWRLPQAIELEKKRKEVEVAERSWFRNLRIWRGWLDGSKDQRARVNVREIDDPAATKALIHYLKEADNYDHKTLYATALSKIGSTEAIEELAMATIKTANENFRYEVLDLLAQKKPPRAVEVYIAALKSKVNDEVNHAGVGLAYMKNPVAIRPLIDALVTTHKRKVGGKSGQISPTLSNDGRGNSSTGLGLGGGAKIISENLPNRDVLDALVELTNEDFDYDRRAWKKWYASRKKPAAVGGRRD